MKAADWIDQVKQARGWESDYRASKELGLSRNTISNYRQGVRNTLDDDTAVKVAAALGRDPEIVILDQVAERTRSEPARAALERVIKRLGGVAAGVVIAAGLLSPPAPAAAKVLAPTAEGLRIMSNDKRRRRRHGVVATMAALLQSLTQAPARTLTA